MKHLETTQEAQFELYIFLENKGLLVKSALAPLQGLTINNRS